jgi:hypothetical protein
MAFCYGSSKLSEDEKAAKIASVHIMMMDSDFSSANKRDLNDKIAASLFGSFLPLLHCSSLFCFDGDGEKFEFYANRRRENFSIQNYDTSSWPHQTTLTIKIIIFHGNLRLLL